MICNYLYICLHIYVRLKIHKSWNDAYSPHFYMFTVQDAAWHIVGTQQILVWMTGRDGKESKYEEIQTKKVFFFFFLQNLK